MTEFENIDQDTAICASEEDILSCQFDKWYSIFERNTIKSRIIPLTAEFMEYLEEDGVFMPNSADDDVSDNISDDEDVFEVLEENRDKSAVDTNNNDNNVNDNNNYRNNNDSDDNDMSIKKHDFSTIDLHIQAALDQFKNEVFIKLNWSAPIDASWMVGGSLKCQSLSDIYLLLKSSNRVIFDMEKMFKECKGDSTRIAPDVFTLIVRKWANLQPSMEFRCFVQNHQLIGICQRNCTTYFPFLSDDKDRLQQLLETFYKDHICGRLSLSAYVIDLYIDKKDRVWIVDINPFGCPTCSLMFDWTEWVENVPPNTTPSNDCDSSSSVPIWAEFRLVESEGEVLASSKGSHRGPVDVHMSSDFPRFMEICKAQAKEK
jgi:hypothetical protein